MTTDPQSERWTIARIKARTWLHTMIQLAGFTLIFWAAYSFFGPILLEYYRQTSSVPAAITNATELVPVLDSVSALAVFAAGAFTVHFTTR